MTSEPRPSSAIDEEIALVPWQPIWPALFKAEQERLQTQLPELTRLEHFGSTAIPGMTAKPIIDILAGVSSMAEADRLFEPILRAGYQTSREFNATLSDRRWFMRVTDGRRSHHLHVVEFDGSQWVERLRFRDILRVDAGLARQYADLKVGLAVRFRHDRDGYTNAKSDFVALVAARSSGGIGTPGPAV
ncbi:MAG: GrpB family protein [Caldimonas sp.]